MNVIVGNAENSKVLIKIQGRIDTITSQQLQDSLSNVNFQDNDIVFDFLDVEYISSAGLRQMMIARKKNLERTMYIKNVSKAVLDIFQTTGFDTFFNITENESGKSTYVQKSFKQVLKEKAKANPQTVFLTSSDVAYTWEEVDKCSQIIANDLSKLGVKKGTHVGLCSANSANWVLTFFAIQKLGGIACLLNFAYGADEIVKVAEVGDVDYLCIGEVSTMKDKESFISEIKTGTIKTVYDINSGIAFKERISEYEAIKSLYEETVESDDACVMIYTSGSTGVPKGVLISSYNILNASLSMSETIRITESDKLCLILPLFHIFGMTAGLFCNILNDGQIIIPKDIRTTTLLNTIEEKGCTLFHSVPTMLLALMNNKEFNTKRVSTLRASILAGAPVTKSQLLDMHDKFTSVRFFCAYGLSEMAPISITAYDDEIETVCTTVGKPVDNIRIMIQNPSTNEACKAGEIGEILVEGYNLMICYYKVRLEDQAINEEGWLHTGDLGFLDENDYLHITGRIKELIIRGGENIMPSEVEGAITKNSDIENVKVVGVPDNFFGEAVCACLVMKPDKVFDEDAMKEFLLKQLSKYKVPAHYMVFDSFPKLSSGKIDAVSIKKAATEKFGTK